MANIGFNFESLNLHDTRKQTDKSVPQLDAAPCSPIGIGWLTPNLETAPSRPPPRREATVLPTQSKPLAASLRRELNQKQAGSIVLNRRFAISESLDASKAWFLREVEAQLERGGLFEDPFMPPVDATISLGQSTKNSRYNWLRPRVRFLKFSLTHFVVGNRKQTRICRRWAKSFRYSAR